MPAEQEGSGIPLSGIHISFQERSITFAAQDKPLAKLTFSPDGAIYFHAHPDAPAVSPEPPQLQDLPAPQTEVAAAPPEQQERQRTVTLTGRLKSKPRAGHPDRTGKPTTVAHLAVHEEGREDPRVFYATFHRHTARLALGLPVNAQVTVTGYPHPSGDATGKRLDTFSVINLVDYPGKPQKKQG